MIASFQLVRFRRLVPVPPRRLPGRVPGLRCWQAFNVGGDFAHFREHPTRWALYPRLRPDFRRWAFFAVWDDEAAFDSFRARLAAPDSPLPTATESLHVGMRATRIQGSWPGLAMLREPTSATGAVLASAPVAYLVRLDLSLRGTLTFWGSAAPGILHHLPGGDDLLLGVPLVDRPYTQPATFGLWRTSAAATSFAYRHTGHRDAVDRVQRAMPDLRSHYSSGSFGPYVCEGTWHRRNPLKELLVSPVT